MTEFRPLLSRKSTFASSIELNDLHLNIFPQTSSNEELQEQFEKVVDPMLKKGKFFRCLNVLSKIYSTQGDYLNFRSKFRLFRRIICCANGLAEKYFVKKDRKKHLSKMEGLFEKSFFFLKEWLKTAEHYIAECGNPELRFVKELKESLLPLSFKERNLLFYQKNSESFKVDCIVFFLLIVKLI